MAWISQIIESIIPTKPVAPGEPVALPFRMERGTFSTTARAAYRVSFSKPYPEPPTVVCSGGAKTGTVAPHTFRVRRITAPRVEVPIVPIVSLPTKPAFSPLSVPSITLTPPTLPTVSLPTVALSAPTMPTLGIPTGKEIADYIIKLKVPVTWRGRTYSVWWLKFGDPAAPTIDGRKWSALALHIDAAMGYAWWCDDILPGLSAIGETFWTFGDFWDTYIGTPIIKKVNEVTSMLTTQFRDTKYKVDKVISDIKTTVEWWESQIKSEIEDKIKVGWTTLTGHVSKLDSEVTTKLNPIMTEVTGAIDRIRASIEPSFIILKSEVDAKLGRLGSEMTRFSDDANYIWEGMSAEVMKGLDKGIKGLYNLVGVREGVFLNPVAVRDVTRDGFTIEGTEGGTYYWVAIGFP